MIKKHKFHSNFGILVFKKYEDRHECYWSPRQNLRFFSSAPLDSFLVTHTRKTFPYIFFHLSSSHFMLRSMHEIHITNSWPWLFVVIYFFLWIFVWYFAWIIKWVNYCINKIHLTIWHAMQNERKSMWYISRFDNYEWNYYCCSSWSC